jgi:hypothetical protein
MGNRKRAPVLAHLLAAFMGMGFDPELAKDYWLGREEPWSAEQDVPSRFAKLAYMYAASAITQVGIPWVLMVVIAELFRTPPSQSLRLSAFAWYLAAGFTLFAIAVGLLMAFLAWRRVMKERKSMRG